MPHRNDGRVTFTPVVGNQRFVVDRAFKLWEILTLDACSNTVVLWGITALFCADFFGHHDGETPGRGTTVVTAVGNENRTAQSSVGSWVLLCF